ncbi:response regulator [Emticicia sp. CRIBPO]|uniref:response regulator n=1 Tax=Emticicia sp. CRIBPO TaxID=2683258 RepID=UPI001412F1F9|nr:response regulator [Emticicia sp. CRIBPO]NBA86931.1 response regulator [Emticicia sp. CRIBPO]
MAQKITCFLVDDDREDQEIFMMALEDVNYEISLRCFDDGVALLDTLHQKDEPLPQLVFLDLNMAKMNGKECLAALVNDETLSDIRIIIYSTSSNIKDINESKKLGAFDYIVKPASFDTLVTTLERIFGSVAPKEKTSH